MKQIILWLFILIFLSPAILRAQALKSDTEMISAQNFKNIKYNRREVKFLLIGKNAIVHYNPVSLFFSGLLFTYQRIISPQISAGCAYEISCSNFSKRCISEFGLVKGVALSADRLMRCNRVAAYDIHPMNITKDNKVIDPPVKYKWKTYK